MKKPILLFLALLLPALIFVFLKFAGKNEFTVPVFHEKGVTLPADCISSNAPDTVAFAAPYTVPHEWRDEWKMNRDVNVVVFPADKLDFDKLKRAIDDEIGMEVVWFNKAGHLSPDSVKVDRMKECIFFVNEPSQSVLVDKEGRIRGYYDLTKRDEVDRLRVELKIILKKY